MNATAWQLASILGPAAGGLLYGIGPTSCRIRRRPASDRHRVQHQPDPGAGAASADQETSLATLLAGFRYIWGKKVVLGAISLDLFAVLMGGAVALMPVFAKDILDAGPWGTRASARGARHRGDFDGAVAGAVSDTRQCRNHPVRLRGGVRLLHPVSSASRPRLAVDPALALVGACDMVSVSIRETIMQLWTPDSVRGRVNAVNSVFIGASNELGEFRAGVMASFIGRRRRWCSAEPRPWPSQASGARSFRASAGRRHRPQDGRRLGSSLTSARRALCPDHLLAFWARQAHPGSSIFRGLSVTRKGGRGGRGPIRFLKGHAMSKRIQSSTRSIAVLGENLWGRPKSPLNARAYGPGQHGQRRKGKTSDYGLQLRAKQKLKGYYGSITEKAVQQALRRRLPASRATPASA
jgi:hypothetical protein